MAKKRVRTQAIRVKSDRPHEPIEIRGWLGAHDHTTYLWFGIDNRMIGTLSGAKLYRLCAAILKRKPSRKRGD